MPYKIFSIDRYSGYEATLVGLTRHELDCQIFAAKDTLENELYKTKDLDVEAVRQEFHTIGYEYVQKVNEAGNDVWQKQDVPLWKGDSNVVIAKFDELLKACSDPAQLSSVISNNPEMLGSVRARSLVAKIFGSDERKAVDINLAKLGNRLSQYIKGKNEMQQLSKMSIVENM